MKRKKVTTAADISQDLLESILSRLSIPDVFRIKSVCSFWRSIAQNCRPPFPQTPWLLLPSLGKGKTHYSADDENAARCFFSLQENRFYSSAAAAAAADDERRTETSVVGSSRGWLILLDKSKPSFPSCRLLNPITRAQFQLPTLPSPFECYKVFPLYGTSKITKAVLSSDPIKNSKFWVIAISPDDLSGKLMFHRNGDDAWSEADGGFPKFYCDIICSGDQLFAAGSDGSIEVWDLQGPSKPEKQRTIAAGRLVAEALDFALKGREPGPCVTQSYVAESLGKLLLVVRVIGEFVSGDGRLLSESDLLSEQDSHPLVCPYKTLSFRVFELEPKSEEWAAVESIGDQALFVGGSESIALSSRGIEGVEGSCIYFTDDYWDRVDEDYLYGGHDNGVFSLKEQKFRPVSDELELVRKIVPLPYWFTPNPWR